MTPVRHDDPVPNQPKTPRRTVRISEDLWEKAQKEAARRNETVSDAIRRALERYIHGDGK
jgi:hypothetical protein